MGCPQRVIEKQGAGAALIKNPELASEIIKETIRGAGNLPVSVKTRLGYNTISLEDWIPRLAESGISALTVHGRTRKEMSAVPARWDEIARAAEITRSHPPTA
jgi:tRNA-dihydrouridine synthase